VASIREEAGLTSGYGGSNGSEHQKEGVAQVEAEDFVYMIARMGELVIVGNKVRSVLGRQKGPGVDKKVAEKDVGMREGW
jgi:hypothetical protein